MKKPLFALLTLAFAAPLLAQEVTYTKDIRPLWEEHCERCHGAKSPTYEDFAKSKASAAAASDDSDGPRMDSYERMMYHLTGPRSGALMRMLDDGSNTADRHPGGMFRHLGRRAERKGNLDLFKRWIGEGAWVVKEPGQLSQEEVQKIKAAK